MNTTNTTIAADEKMEQIAEMSKTIESLYAFATENKMLNINFTNNFNCGQMIEIAQLILTRDDAINMKPWIILLDESIRYLGRLMKLPITSRERSMDVLSKKIRELDVMSITLQINYDEPTMVDCGILDISECKNFDEILSCIINFMQTQKRRFLVIINESLPFRAADKKHLCTIKDASPESYTRQTIKNMATDIMILMMERGYLSYIFEGHLIIFNKKSESLKDGIYSTFPSFDAFCLGFQDVLSRIGDRLSAQRQSYPGITNEELVEKIFNRDITSLNQYLSLWTMVGSLLAVDAAITENIVRKALIYIEPDCRSKEINEIYQKIINKRGATIGNLPQNIGSKYLNYVNDLMKTKDSLDGEYTQLINDVGAILDQLKIDLFKKI